MSGKWIGRSAFHPVEGGIDQAQHLGAERGVGRDNFGNVTQTKISTVDGLKELHRHPWKGRQVVSAANCGIDLVA
jgi:hypothetical protein